ncbi:unnamed protein product [Vitrella brassicaformis CCMP3155]|uniref:Apple domain-containing protein n=1 Tax=Vitrella brassicaformis (strain CCMP3155) TaxID=1169540 RepID=A0A0G4FPW0_VITBC|nr:unnamed protein product [Vitrella brassicaformis CCMP3155]|eukprot:CEM16503.1 unnamed protein product [Vitrella brassicaformis CCMP3155]
MLASIAFCVWGCVAVGAHAVVAANGRNAFARYRRVDGRGRVSAFPFPAADSLPAQQLVQITSNRTDEGQGGPFGRYMVMIKNKDYRGNDIRSIGGVKSQEECARKCFEHGSCKAMSYDNRWGRHRCWIKRTNKNLRVLMNVFTGFMSNECKGGDYCVDRFGE